MTSTAIRKNPWWLGLTLSAALSLTACGGGEGSGTTPKGDTPRFPAVQLTLAHVNDHHSQLDAFPATELQIDGVPTRVELGGFARVTAAFKAYDKRNDVIKLHAGDAITGSLYYTLFKGEADAAMMNTVCFDAFALGNHEFDDSDAGLKVFLDHLRSGSCQTPVLAANVKPALGTPLAMTSATDYLQPYTVKTVKGVKVAIIGIDIKGKTTNSSRPLDTTVFEDETEAAQRTEFYRAAVEALRSLPGVTAAAVGLAALPEGWWTDLRLKVARRLPR